MAATVSFQDTGEDHSGSDTVTIPLTVASAAGQERVVAFALLGGNTAPEHSDPTSVTVDGEAGTLLLRVNGAAVGSCAILFIYRAAGTSGTTINAIAVMPGANPDLFEAAGAAWTLSDAGTVQDTASSSADDPTLSVNTVDNGAVIAVGYRYSDSAGPTSTWSGLTERFDSNIPFGNAVMTGADVNVSTGETPRAISIAWGAFGTNTSGGSGSVSFNPEAAAVVYGDSYLLESGGDDEYTLEDGTGVLLLEAIAPAGGAATKMHHYRQRRV